MAFLAVAVLLAVLRGGAPERWFGFILAAMLLLDRAGHVLLGTDHAEISALHLIIDLASFGAMMTVMIYARRLWPIWACSFQLLSVASHATLIMAKLPAIVPAILGIAPSYGIFVSLILGILLHQARVRRHGSDPSWRTYSRRVEMPMRSNIPRDC